MKYLVRSLGVLAGGVMVLLFAMNVFHPRTHEYLLKDPQDAGERMKLLEQLEKEKLSLLNMAEWDAMNSAVNDPDQYWPMERLTIVIAIQKFALHQREVPAVLEDLSGRLPEETKNSLSSDYQLLDAGEGRWKLVKHDEFTVAVGN